MNVPLGGEVVVKTRLTAHVRTYFSISHVLGASMFAREAARIERDYAHEDWPKVHSIHRSYVVGAIFSSVAFVESTINEVFADAADSNIHEHLRGIDPTFVPLLRSGPPRRGAGTLDKYDAALLAIGRPVFGTDTAPRQEVQHLVWLRNALVHFQPESLLAIDSEHGPIPQHKLERLLSEQFSLNPFSGAGNPFWPDKCLSHGCAAWAVAASVRFVDGFTSMVGTASHIEHVRAQLETT